eukprot:TRINITY_DN103935_c0_g1_i1.p1 TRINITY_DN103935_c0_g1~~TRINITY_DN103935_c0_g1_i1.p1  ORF type:complete len:510 (+),score=162.04 TRINITY_DN103935_c0_g1_i1:82-1611(+)
MVSRDATPKAGVKPPARQATPQKSPSSSNGGKSAAAVEEREAELAEARENITMLKAPIKTLTLAFVGIVDYILYYSALMLKSYITWFVLLPFVASWMAVKYHFNPELFSEPVCGSKEAGVLWWAELYLKEFSWWLLLGILSSVGFGTGLHSGIMFLFPHVMQVVGAAEGCHTTNGLIGWYQHPCKLDCSTTYGAKDDSTVTFLRLWGLVTVQCMVWGIGTAFGELPPYLVSKAARQAGKRDADFDRELEEARGSSNLLDRMKVWTIDFTEKRGWIGVFLLASWPNAAFDMCGMCCGYLMMPFWTFFTACCLGKGVVKVNGQAVVFVNLFGTNFFHLILQGVDSVNNSIKGALGKDLGLKALLEKGRHKLISKFELQSRFLPEKLFTNDADGLLDHGEIKELYIKHDDAHSIAERVIKELDSNKDGMISVTELGPATSATDSKLSLASMDPGDGNVNPMKFLWDLFLAALILYFFWAVMEQIARSKQAEYDEAELEKMKSGDKKEKKKDK